MAEAETEEISIWDTVAEGKKFFLPNVSARRLEKRERRWEWAGGQKTTLNGDYVHTGVLLVGNSLFVTMESDGGERYGLLRYQAAGASICLA